MTNDGTKSEVSFEAPFVAHKTRQLLAKQIIYQRELSIWLLLPQVMFAIVKVLGKSLIIIRRQFRLSSFSLLEQLWWMAFKKRNFRQSSRKP